MKLSDLKAGRHLVEMRNGWRYLVLKGDHGLFLSREIDCIPKLTGFNDDMTHFNSSNELDIVKVFSLTPEGLRDSFDLIRDDKPIWERQEKPSFHEEIEDLQVLISTLNSKLENINKNLKGFSDK